MSVKRIAYWMSDKKSQKVNWGEFEAACRKNGFDLFRLNLFENYESQEPFCLFLHKLTDFIALAEQGDEKSTAVINKLESYLTTRNVIVIDPIQRVRTLLDRYQAYSIIQSTNLKKYKVFTPTFCEISNSNEKLILEQLEASKVNYPFICKPAIGHGSKAHAMCIIFDQNGLKDCKAPCVAQTFINHNAVLYKIYIVGNKFSIIERPSLKNFHNTGKSQATIFFDSGIISKAGSQSWLTYLDPQDLTLEKPRPNFDTMQRIASTLREAFGMDLLGIDVVIENSTGKYAIIDVNAYPGYDGFPDFYTTLLELIREKVDDKYT